MSEQPIIETPEQAEALSDFLGTMYKGRTGRPGWQIKRPFTTDQKGKKARIRRRALKKLSRQY